MRKSLSVIALVLLSFLFNAFIGVSEKTVKDFTLTNTDGKSVSLKDYPEAKGFIVVFTCNHCPFAKLYPERLKELSLKFSSQRVPLIAISSTDTLMYDQDTYREMVRRAREEQYNFPYLYDKTQAVAKEFGAQKTPHAFVLWKENDQWKIKYNGAVDDNGEEPAKVIHHYVEDAVHALLSGKPVPVTETKSIGCQIRWRK